MLLIKCPYCGERDQSEFGFGGEAHRKRPENPEQLSDVEWADYLFMRKNVKGNAHEQWVHSAGCRKYFQVVRDTVSYEILDVYEMGGNSKYNLDGTLKSEGASQQSTKSESSDAVSGNKGADNE